MRPKKRRHIYGQIEANYFKPRGVPLSQLQEIELLAEEVEALRLAHQEAFYQEQAAEKMKVSRQTFGRILDQAHKKITDAVVNGKALRVDSVTKECDSE